MTANHAHTPDTERVAGLYAAAVYELNVGGPVPDPDAEFDRWHAAEIAAAEKRGAIKALRDAAESNDLIDHMYEQFDPPHEPLAVRATARYLHNRADQVQDPDAPTADELYQDWLETRAGQTPEENHE